MVACSKTKSTTTNKPSGESGEVEPDQLRPQLDTRFQEKFFAAQSEKAKGNINAAYNLFNECLKIEPDNGATHYELGRIDLQVLNDANSALDHAKRCVESDKTNGWYQMLLAECYLALAKYDLAIKTYTEVIRLNPDDPNVLYEKANAQLYAGKYSDAIITYDELEKKSGPYEELTMQKHQLYMQIGNKSKAGEELEKLARHFSDEPRFWGLAAQFYRDMGMEEKWVEALREMEKTAPGNGQVHYQLSEYYAAKGDSKKSYDELKLAFQTTDLSIDQKMMVLLKYMSLTDFKPEFSGQAYELLDLTESLHSGEAKVFSIYGDFLYRDGKKQEALNKYIKARDLDASHKLIWEQILIIQSELSQFQAMAKGSKDAIGLYPALPDFYYYSGLANSRLKNYDVAIEDLRIGKELVIENNMMLLQFYSLLGESYHYASRHKESDEAYEEALRIDSDNVFVLNNYAYYLSLRKEKLDKAASMSARCNELQPGVSSFEDTYAWILFQQKKYQDALLWIEKALSRGEINGELLEHHGDILYQLGRTAEAVTKWKEAENKGGAGPKIRQKIETQKLID
jgi:tetratricopeptide (TPR) repeat protein